MTDDIVLPNGEIENLQPNDLVNTLADLFRQGRLAQEYATYTFWEMARDGRFSDVISSETGQPINTQDEFIEYVRHKIGVSRQTMYSRNKVYDILTYLGYDKRDIIIRVAENPYVYQRTLAALVDWDVKNNTPRDWSLPDEPEDEEDAKAKTRDILDAQGVIDGASNKLSYVQNDLLGKPEIKVYWNNDMLMVEYTTHAVDSSGKSYMTGSGKVMYLPSTDLPDAIKDCIKFVINLK